MALPILASRGIASVARASLPAARQAARRLIAAGGRLISRPLPAAAIGTGVGALATAPFLRGGRMPQFGGMRRRRARGITATELRGARKVASLVKMYGMKPKAGKVGRRRKVC